MKFWAVLAIWVPVDDQRLKKRTLGKILVVECKTKDRAIQLVAQKAISDEAEKGNEVKIRRVQAREIEGAVPLDLARAPVTIQWGEQSVTYRQIGTKADIEDR